MCYTIEIIGLYKNTKNNKVLYFVFSKNNHEKGGFNLESQKLGYYHLQN